MEFLLRAFRINQIYNTTITICQILKEGEASSVFHELPYGQSNTWRQNPLYFEPLALLLYLHLLKCQIEVTAYSSSELRQTFSTISGTDLLSLMQTEKFAHTNRSAFFHASTFFVLSPSGLVHPTLLQYTHNSVGRLAVAGFVYCYDSILKLLAARLLK